MEQLPSPTTFRLEQPGHYMVLLANCNPNGREIHFDGSAIFSRQAVEANENQGNLVEVVGVVCIFVFIRRWRQRVGGGFGGGGGSYINLELQGML
jgi:hypothetical protein